MPSRSSQRLKPMPSVSPTCPTLNEMCATGLTAGTFRSSLLIMRRYHKRPQKMVIHLRCITTVKQSIRNCHADLCPGLTLCARRILAHVTALRTVRYRHGLLVMEHRDSSDVNLSVNWHLDRGDAERQVHPCRSVHVTFCHECLIVVMRNAPRGYRRAHMSYTLASTREADARLRTRSLLMCVCRAVGLQE